MRSEHDLTRRRPVALESLYRQDDRLLGLLAGVLADRGEVHVGEPGQRAVVITHDRKGTGYRHAPPGERVEQPDGAAVVGRHHRGGQAPLGQQRDGGADACLLGVVTGG